MQKVLVISVHPDDETLGCGGTLLKHQVSGDLIFWLILTNIDEKNGWDNSTVKKRITEIDKVAFEFKFKKVIKLDFPTTKLDSIPIDIIIKRISEVIKDIEPEILYIPNRTDIHTDHQTAFKAIISCTKNFRYPFIKKLLMYECLSETEFAPPLPENIFIPNVFTDISDYFEKKQEIFKIYQSELMNDFLPRSSSTIESLARFRGSRINVQYAESFMLLLLIQ